MARLDGITEPEQKKSGTGRNKKILVKRGHVKNRFQITINSLFKACCSSSGSSCMPQMAHKKEES
jgi:hypothetical protein